MKVMVIYSWARNPADAVVRDDGTVDWRGARMAAGEDDPAALAAAKSIAESAGGIVTGLTIGDGDATWALARGVGSTVSVGDVPHLADNAATAKVLAAAVRDAGDVDVVVVGDPKQDPGVAAALAGELGWPALVGQSTASAEDDGTARVLAVRATAGAAVTTAVPTPVVLGVAADADVDRAPGMKEQLAARKRPVTRVTTSDLGTAAVDLPSRGTRRPETTVANVFTGPPAETVDRLLAALRERGTL